MEFKLMNNHFNPVTDTIKQELTTIVGAANISAAQAERELRAKDMSGHKAHLSEVVVWPTEAPQVAAVLQLAHQNHIPVTPWGVGSSLEGNPIPLHGGILLSSEKMTKIVAIHADDFQVTVQPGLGYKDLNEKLVPYGLFYAPDPGANATIGGMLANNAAGIRTVKYGACKDNVLQMQVALPDGRLFHVGSRSIKQSSGYDLLHLFVGSEGTLGVITEATLRLVPIPNLMSAVVATFPTVAAAVETVVAIRGSGLEPAALEFIDHFTADMLTQETDVDFGPRPTLFMEFHAAHQESLNQGLTIVEEICQEMEANSFRASTDTAQRRQLWHARHHMFEILVRLHPGQEWVIVDTAVPLSTYPDLVAHSQDTLRRHEHPGFMVGHAGDGNLHVSIPFHDDTTYQEAQNINREIVVKAINLGGTATGEHGVGIGKSRYMHQEHGHGLAVMQAIKHTLDPHGIMNPGKIFPNPK